MLRLLWFCALLLSAGVVNPTTAQPAVAEAVPAAEGAFQSGLDSYEEGDYRSATRHFLRAAEGYGYNVRTTAAALMAGKSAYAAGDLDRAVALFTDLIQTYPQSRYAGEAERVREQALTAGKVGRQPVQIGVALPVSGAAEPLGQALFNGIRLAVEGHNAGRPDHQIRLVFRATDGGAGRAAAAVRELAEAGVGVVIGPLFSEEAREAAAAAEDADVVLLAPLATDTEVSSGRTRVFQMNPTFPARARVMARYVALDLRLNQVGVVSRRDGFSNAMGDAFAEEVQQLGVEVVFHADLQSRGDWNRIDQVVGRSRLSNVDAVYLPVTGRQAPEHAAGALRSLEQAPRPPRPLGNTEWEGLTGSRDRAARLGAVYTQDFFVAPGALADFAPAYERLAGIGPDRTSLMGYDAAQFLIDLLETNAEGILAERIRQASRFDGLGHRFDFEGGQVNHALFIMAYRGGQSVLLE